MMKRRDVLKLAGAGLVAPFAGSLLSAREAAAQARQIVVMTGGGTWGDMMKADYDAAYEKQFGIKVVQDRASSPVQRITKMKINLNNQLFDIVQIHDGVVPLAISQGTLEKLNPDSPRLGNLRDIPAQFKNDYAAGQMFSSIGITYNSKLVKNPPTGYADLWKPEFKGRIVLPEISHSIGTYTMPIGALAQGASVKDEKVGFEQLKRMADLKPIWAKDTDSIMNAFRSEEAVIGLLYKSQTWTVKDWGVPVEWVYPREGGILYAWYTGIAKNTKNLELAEQYVNLTLDPQLQTVITRKFNYPGTNPKMLGFLTPDLRERAELTPDQLARLIPLDQEFMSERRAEWTQKWNEIVANS